MTHRSFFEKQLPLSHAENSFVHTRKARKQRGNGSFFHSSKRTMKKNINTLFSRLCFAATLVLLAACGGDDDGIQFGDDTGQGGGGVVVIPSRDITSRMETPQVKTDGTTQLVQHSTTNSSGREIMAYSLEYDKTNTIRVGLPSASMATPVPATCRVPKNLLPTTRNSVPTFTLAAVASEADTTAVTFAPRPTAFTRARPTKSLFT